MTVGKDVGWATTALNIVRRKDAELQIPKNRSALSPQFRVHENKK